jgi:hypothetical protein
VARKAELFDSAEGDVVRGYILLRQSGANIHSEWLSRSRASRKRRETDVAQALQSGSIKDLPIVEEWAEAFGKECFYKGIRCLLDLERNGNTDL